MTPISCTRGARAIQKMKISQLSTMFSDLEPDGMAQLQKGRRFQAIELSGMQRELTEADAKKILRLPAETISLRDLIITHAALKKFIEASPTRTITIGRIWCPDIDTGLSQVKSVFPGCTVSVSSPVPKRIAEELAQRSGAC
ncbi:MAG: hypothetical protein K2Z81_10715 [Cyanobacteria bacterium]|nr:hypothetical protein [Cyanobacteriota bacterium]